MFVHSKLINNSEKLTLKIFALFGDKKIALSRENDMYDVIGIIDLPRNRP